MSKHTRQCVPDPNYKPRAKNPELIRRAIRHVLANRKPLTAEQQEQHDHEAQMMKAHEEQQRKMNPHIDFDNPGPTVE